MTPSIPHNLAELNIDVEQWRSEIATFSEATQDALGAIIAELSRSCTSSTARNELGNADEMGSSNSKTNVVYERRRAMQIAAPFDDTGDSVPAPNNRLGSLKQRLAEQITQTLAANQPRQ